MRASGFMSYLRTLPGLLLTAVLAAPLGVQGEEPPAVTADLIYTSRYVHRGIERAGPSAQAGVELAHENLRGGGWINQPLASGAVRESNLSAAYTWPSDRGFTLEASVVHRWFSGVPGGAVKRSFEAGLSATLPAVQGCTPGLAYCHDFRLNADTTQVSLARSFALTRLGAFLELEGLAGWSTGDDWRPDAIGPPRHDSYRYWSGSARLPYRIGLHSTVIAGLHYADASGRSVVNGPFGLTERRNLWVTLGVNLDF